MPLTGGQTFAGYRIVRLLGSGGMGEVYLAEHPRLPRRDALKVLPADVSADPDYRARFIREADLASKLYHPNIVGVHDRGEHEGQLWISMDYVDGVDAGRLLTERYRAGMPVGQVKRIVTALAGALDYAHKQGLLHRDVKPANIMLTHVDDDKAEPRILLTDFGIARNVDDISGLTATNFTVGTVAYSAPEQLMGRDLDGRVDQYALAATAHHLLTGSQLFPYSNQAVIISHHLNATAPALSDTHPELAPLDPALARALAKDPDDRFACCLDFAHALSEPSYEQESPSPVATTKSAPVPHRSIVSAAPAGPAPPQQSAMRSSRYRWLPAAVAVAVILLASGIALAWPPWERGDSTSAPTTSAQPPAAASSTSAQPAPAASPPPQVFPASAIDTVLLTPTEISTIVPVASTVPLPQVQQTTHGMLNNSNLVTPQDCVGMIFTAERAVFADTGFVAMRNQTLGPPNGGYGPQTGLTQVQQSAIAYPTPDQAQSLLASSQRQWRTCASGEVKLGTVGQNGENGLTFNFGSVKSINGVLAVSMVANSQEAIGSACQQAMAAKANVVVAVRACRAPEPPPGQLEADVSSVHKDAEPLVSAMIDKINA
jgi:serine/threonine-protein kinase